MTEFFIWRWGPPAEKYPSKVRSAKWSVIWEKRRIEPKPAQGKSSRGNAVSLGDIRASTNRRKGKARLFTPLVCFGRGRAGPSSRVTHSCRGLSGPGRIDVGKQRLQTICLRRYISPVVRASPSTTYHPQPHSPLYTTSGIRTARNSLPGPHVTQVRRATMLLAFLSLAFAASSVTANTEKVIFLGPEARPVPVDSPTLDDLQLPELSPHRWALRTHLDAAFPTDAAALGSSSWVLLNGLKEGQRYEVRVCWAATVRLSLKICVYIKKGGFTKAILILKFAPIRNQPPSPSQPTTCPPSSPLPLS